MSKAQSSMSRCAANTTRCANKYKEINTISWRERSCESGAMATALLKTQIGLCAALLAS
jgi:hypothetical protein